ncbi:MAG: alpha/beta hydrolase [Rhodococcus sp. (in: high G+C Gram-positive bacteria)]|uniref:alpha/beta fold hydrolase n=1 Tax=Rhodococcus sp. TaxID=1831 RepID=UPI002AD67B6B|nr:alpha/beta hydrolase [Rhodococcus sp. (in: high G+C Gram-positive bacteria)]MDZ7928987.1 alpha/beta hydrolase [Rhodococcus sp. (in: high G+C Gram-positive bacteria)]
MIPSPDASALLESVHLVRAGDGPPVALAHGAGGGVLANFATVIEHFRAERSLIGVDYPGSGDTPVASTPLSLEALADAVVEAMVTVGYERFPILGLSLGTAVAVTAAVRHPDRVTGLVLTVGLATADMQLTSLFAVRRRLVELREWDALAHLMLYATSPGTLSDISMEERDAFLVQMGEKYPVKTAAQSELAATVDIEHLLPRLNLPALVIAAGQDRFVLPSTTRALADGIAGAEMIEYPDAGHIFTPGETNQWIEDIGKFLRQHRL